MNNAKEEKKLQTKMLEAKKPVFQEPFIKGSIDTFIINFIYSFPTLHFVSSFLIVDLTIAPHERSTI